MSTKTRFVRWIPGVAITLAVMLAVGLVYYLKTWLGEDTVQAKKLVQQITLLTPPPPPPPPKVDEPPPPEVEEKVELPEPEPLPEDLPEQADEAPPGEQLGLDAEGGAGGDGFGLTGNKGGRALLGGNGGGAEAWYKRMLGQELQSLLNGHDAVRKRRYSAIVNLWLDAGGRIERVELMKSTGDKELDRALKTALADIERVRQPPPTGTEQPVRLRVVSRL